MIYLSGKISENSNYEEEFEEAEKYFSEKTGNFVFNPADAGKTYRRRCIDTLRAEPTWEDYMIMDIRQLFKSSMLVSLPNWKESKGARIERAIAEILGMEIVDFKKEE